MWRRSEVRTVVVADLEGQPCLRNDFGRVAAASLEEDVRQQTGHGRSGTSCLRTRTTQFSLKWKMRCLDGLHKIKCDETTGTLEKVGGSCTHHPRMNVGPTLSCQLCSRRVDALASKTPDKRTQLRARPALLRPISMCAGVSACSLKPPTEVVPDDPRSCQPPGSGLAAGLSALMGTHNSATCSPFVRCTRARGGLISTTMPCSALSPTLKTLG